MRIVVTGGSGNVGTSVLRAFAAEPEVSEVVGLARRRPALALPKVTWSAADIRTADLTTIFRGAAEREELLAYFTSAADFLVNH